MASEGESNSHRDSLLLHDRETTFRRLMGSQIISTISTIWDFTTKSGGICTFPLHGRMAHHRLACRLPKRASAPSPYREGNAGRQRGQGPSPATPADPLVQRQGHCRQARDGKSREAHPRGRPRHLGHSGEEDGGSARPATTGVPPPDRCVGCSFRRVTARSVPPSAIPTMRDRAMQALYLLALDPIAETTADPNSYGFRKERSTADAMMQCYINSLPVSIPSMDPGRRYPRLLRSCMLMPPSRTRKTCLRSNIAPRLAGENVQHVDMLCMSHSACLYALNSTSYIIA